ncbi:MAG: hypothetical protein JSU03_10935 [Bacteroidetes bacterium]|nr:hypothetical protein [Bacteroidota bacterium]
MQISKGVPQGGRAFRYYSGTKPGLQSLTGVAAAIPHALVLLFNYTTF